MKFGGRFKVKKKITDKVIKEAARRSRNIKWEARVWHKVNDPKEVEKLIKKELSRWKSKKGSKYTYIVGMLNSPHTLHSLYPYLAYRGYITNVDDDYTSYRK